MIIIIVMSLTDYNDVQPEFNNFVDQTLQLFDVYLNAANGVNSNLADMTPLLGVSNLSIF